MRTHQEIDERSLALHRLIAEKIRRDPVLLDSAKETVARWQTMVCQSSQPYLAEWASILAQGAEASLAMAVEDSPRATALRQSSPFTKVLSNAERFAFLKAWKSHETQ